MFTLNWKLRHGSNTNMEMTDVTLYLEQDSQYILKGYNSKNLTDAFEIIVLQTLHYVV